MAKSEFDPNTENTCEAIIIESKRITSDDTDEVRNIVIRIDDPSFRFMEGQSIGILIPGPHEFGNKYHHRRYSIASARQTEMDEGLTLDLLVRRCFYIDEVSGEQYPGVASNFLCDARPGDGITITGPYRSPFTIPSDTSKNLLMIGTGTGIAPFRAFIQHIYQQHKEWKGKVRLFYGAKSGLDLLYMNDIDNDLTNYYDKDTFEAFQAIGQHALAGPDEALEHSLEQNAAEAWSLMGDPATYVLLAGLGKVAEKLDKTMAKAAGSEELWQKTRQRMIDENRWSELVYN
ncbi:MAG TPA: oxidoreductase [Gammaproteobacteria bacterium]|nr:oxidoreductase [Gammaproteobacteria bacterium]